MDGWMPYAEGGVEIYARAMLPNDQNTENNTSLTVNAYVQPMGTFEFGYDDRNATHYYPHFEPGEGPLVHFTPWDDVAPRTLAPLNVTVIRVMWATIEVGQTYEYVLHVFGSGETPGAPIYVNLISASTSNSFPNWQDISVRKVPELQGLEEDFWIWLELVEPDGVPSIIRSRVQRVGFNHQYDYNVNALTLSGRDYFIRVVGESLLDVKELPAVALPKKFLLHETYPNPFNPATTVRFQISDPTRVQIRVFDLLGQQVAMLVDQQLNAGIFESVWNAEGLSSGVYFVSMTAGDFSAVQKTMLIR